MADLVNYPLEDNFKTSLTQTWTGGTGTINVANTPSFTFPSWVTTYIVVNPGKSNMQVAEINAYDSSAKTMTVSNVTIESGASSNYSAQTHNVGSEVIISDNYEYWKDIATAINSKLDADADMAWDSDTDYAWVIGKSLTTAQRTALSPTNGSIVYDTDIWELYQYIGGSWSAVSAGSTQANASETVAGKVELATSAETQAGTDTGWTWASLVAVPSDVAANEQSGTFVYDEDTWAADAYVITLTPAPSAYTEGMEVRVKIGSWNTNTTASPTINVNSLWAKNIVDRFWDSIAAGVIQAGEVYTMIYDGTSFVTDIRNKVIGWDGSDWALSISSWTTTLTLSNNYIEKNYSSVSISGTATLDVTGSSWTGWIAYIKCLWDFTMSAGTIDASTTWGAGGSGWATWGWEGSSWQQWINTNGASYTNFGICPAETSWAGWAGWSWKAMFVNQYSTFLAAWAGWGWAPGGSGSSWPGGWTWGWILIIEVGWAFNFTGWTIQSNGWNGGSWNTIVGWGWGWAWGSILIVYNELTANSWTIQCDGWDGWTWRTSGSNEWGWGWASYSDGWDGGFDADESTAWTSNSWWTGWAAWPNWAWGWGWWGWWGWAWFYKVVKRTDI